MGCAVQRRVDGKAARMAAQVQHRPPGGIWPQMAAVFLLVEEVAGLLAVFDVYGHEGVVLTDDELRRDSAVDAALALLHALLFAHGKVVALINALRPEHLGQNGENIIPHALHTERDDLERQAVAEFVHRQTGQAIRLAENDAACVRKAQRLPVFPCRTDAALPEGAVDGLAALVRDEPHRDLGAAVEKARALIAHAAVEHLDKAAVLAGVVRPVDFIVIDPAAAGGKRLAAPQADLSRDPTHFRSFLRLVRQSRAGLPVYFLFIIRSGVIIDIVPQAGAHCNCPAGVV